MNGRRTPKPLFRRRLGRPALQIAAAVGAVALAVLFALLAQDVRAWRDVLRHDAVRYTVSRRAQEQWTPSTLLPPTLSERLLAAARDRRALSALRFFAVAHSLGATEGGLTPKDNRIFATSEQALEPLTQDPNPRTASQAYSLLGALLFNEYKMGFPPDPASFLSAIAAMQNAVRADPEAEDAKVNLELLLRQEQADFVKQAQSQAVNNQAPPPGHVAGRGKGAPPSSSQEGDY